MAALFCETFIIFQGGESIRGTAHTFPGFWKQNSVFWAKFAGTLSYIDSILTDSFNRAVRRIHTVIILISTESAVVAGLTVLV